MPFNYGFGWFIDSYHGHRMMLHSGGSPGFSSIICRFPDDRLTIILLANHGDRILEPLAIDLAGKYVPALRRPLGGKDPGPETSLRLREVVAGLLQGRHDAEQFTLPMRSFLKTATGKGFWQWLASHGAFATFEFSDREDTGEGRVLRYRVVLGDNHFWTSVVLTPGDRIAQIRWW